ncbi:MAG: NAD(P)H-binding protein [Actinocatenispora sp.]
MIVVTGATGNVGGQLVRQLHEAGHAVRALSRNPDRLDVPTGVEVAGADLARPDTLLPALAGADAVFLYLARDGAVEVADAIRRAGVQHAVLLSSGAVNSLDADGADAAEPDGVNAIGEHHRHGEKAVEDSGVAWTFLRPYAFAVNARWWGRQIRAEGVVRGPYPESTSAPIHEADIAAVAVRALTEDGHAGRVHSLTGPESLTQAEQVQTLGEALDRPVTFERITVEEAVHAMAGTPEPIVRTLMSIQAASVGHPAVVTSTVAEITGHPARTFAQWAADHVDDFR